MGEDSCCVGGRNNSLVSSVYFRNGNSFLLLFGCGGYLLFAIFLSSFVGTACEKATSSANAMILIVFVRLFLLKSYGTRITI